MLSTPIIDKIYSVAQVLRSSDICNYRRLKCNVIYYFFIGSGESLVRNPPFSPLLLLFDNILLFIDKRHMTIK